MYIYIYIYIYKNTHIFIHIYTDIKGGSQPVGASGLGCSARDWRGGGAPFRFRVSGLRFGVEG